jgi:hypothetical protein
MRFASDYHRTSELVDDNEIGLDFEEEKYCFYLGMYVLGKAGDILTSHVQAMPMNREAFVL